MLGLAVSLGELPAVRKNLTRGHRAALVRAFKGEGFRLYTAMRNRFMQGPYDHLAAPLTKLERKTYRDEAGRLKWLGNKIAYRVADEQGSTLQLLVGPAVWQRSGERGAMQEAAATR